ncbi:tetratricopeptide repeat protein 16 [Ambystoma mexicanum]|uniref:tetratricopeptide repeat protein 16 n=1 Tax=Ambystoma mexicanum TaxID=8296 RepID=UPI0037E95795
MQKEEMAERDEPWPYEMEPQTKSLGLFTTAVTEEKLKEAREKAQNKVFGSSQVFRQVEERRDLLGEYSLPHIVKSRANQHFEAGMTFLSRGDADEAVLAFSKAITLKPEEMAFYVKRAEAFLYLCDFQSAALNLRKACCTSSPREGHRKLLAFTFYLQGQCLFDQKMYLGALESFTCAAELQPSKPLYHFRSIACLAALGRHDDCLRLVNQLLENKANPDLYVLRARLHYQFNKVTSSYQDVEEALRIESGHTAAQALRQHLKKQAGEAKAQAVNKAVEGQLQDALSKICSAIDHQPAEAEYYAFRGTIYRRLQDFSRAMDDFLLAMQLSEAKESPKVLSGPSDGLQALNVDHDVPQGERGDGRRTDTLPSVFSEAQKQLLLTYNDFAVHCYIKGFYQEGLLLLNKALKGEKNEMGLYMNRGDCLFRLGELSLALADYQQALDLSPLDSGVRHRIAMLQNEMGLQEQEQRRYQEAELHFTRAIENQPRLASYYLHRARIRQCLQDQMGAQEDALITLLLDPNNKEAEPLVMGFFPGKSLRDVLDSKLCAVAQGILERNLQMCPSAQLLESSNRDKCQGASRVEDDAGQEGAGACSDVARCMTDEAIYMEMLRSHKRISQEIQHMQQAKEVQMHSEVAVSSAVLPPSAAPRWKSFALATGHHESPAADSRRSFSTSQKHNPAVLKCSPP